jgi:phage terminase large subunit-like protein
MKPTEGIAMNKTTLGVWLLVFTMILSCCNFFLIANTIKEHEGYKNQ